MKYKRILLKLSGEALMGDKNYGIDSNLLEKYSSQIIEVGGDAPISVQSMTFSKTKDIEATVEQINRLHFAGADMVRVAVLDEEDAKALKTIKEKTSLPLIADIHFNYKLGLMAGEYYKHTYLF
jgi:4-hydroxy-3-methylbut-2-en-1-yl diphosphate synthase IspG/GcpE